MSSWHSYPSSFALGHRYLSQLFFDPVVIEEKVDGSQFSFGVFGDEIRMRTRKADLFIDPSGRVSEKMFQKAAESVMRRQFLLRDGWTYRAEYLPKPAAVTLAYNRVPMSVFDPGEPAYLIGFDVARGEEDYLSYDEKREEFERIGLETVPCLFEGRVEDINLIRGLLEHTSLLGGQIEGVVVKNRLRFGMDKKMLVGKYVSEAFKESHRKSWKGANPQTGDIIQTIIREYQSPVRWAKAVQHLREEGKITDTPRDIGSLFREVPADVLKDSEEDIKQELFEHFWPQISRGITAGMADWYKNRLLDQQPVAGYEPKGDDYTYDDGLRRG